LFPSKLRTICWYDFVLVFSVAKAMMCNEVPETTPRKSMRKIPTPKPVALNANGNPKIPFI
jgi:hypothetical protein